MRSQKHLYALLSSIYLIISCHQLGYSQTPDALSLQQAIELAQKNNLSIVVSKLNVQQSESRVREAQGSRMPSILFHSHFLHAPANGYNEIVTNGGEYGIQFASGYPLYDGGVRSATIDQLLNNKERASVNLQRNKIEIAFSVKTIYYEILRAREEIRIRQEAMERLKDYVSFLDQLRLGGNATESDVLKAQVDLNNADILFDQARQSLHKSNRMLLNVLGVSSDRTFEILPIDKEDSISIPQFSIENNPDLQMLQHENISADYDITIAKGERLPVLSIAGDVGVLGVKPVELHQDVGYSLLVSLEIPLFTWGAIGERIEQKELAREQIEAQLKSQQRELITTWDVTLSDLEIARKNIKSYANNISQAEQNYLSAKSRLAGGSGSNLEVLDAQRLLVEAKLNYNTSVFQLRYDLATALKLSGQQ